MRKYFTYDGQAQHGPFTFEELKFQKLSKSTPIWYEGLGDWTTVDQLQELSHLVNTPPPFKVQTSPPPIPSSNYFDLPVEPKKKSMLLPASISGSIIIAGIIGWLMYNNQTQASEIETQSVQLQQVQQIQDATNAEAKAKEEEQKRINDAITKKNMEFRNNWSKYIAIGRTPYVYSAIGGIDPCDVPVNNKTEYILDEVQVEISYIKTNGEVYKTETVSIYNIPPGSEKSVQTAGSSRGTSMNAEIISIISKKMHFCYPLYNGNDKDPYFCK